MMRNRKDLLAEEKLIDLVRERPSLYNKGDKNYKNSLFKENCWVSIAQEFGETDTPKQLLDKWDSLRGQYLAFRKKIDFRTSSGTGKRPFFRHEQSMQFCTEKTSNNNKESNIIHIKSEVTESDIDEFVSSDPTTPEDFFSESQLEDTIGISSDSVPMPTCHVATKKDYKTHGKRQLTLFEQGLLKLVEDTNVNYSKDEDEYYQFSQTMAHKLRKIGSADGKKGSELQFKIYQIIHEYEMNL